MSSLASRHVTVVGGANTDAVGRSLAPLVARDSNPGVVRRSPGGVARNVAENLARLGARVTLLTAFGGDADSRELEASCRAAGIVTTPSLLCRDLPGSVYLAILDEEGDMALALSDMRPLERLTPELLASRRSALEHADLVVVDTNLTEESLAFIAEQVSAPLMIDLVSTAKAGRARAILGRITAVKCNAIEAAAVLGLPAPENDAEVEAAALRLVEAGAGAVFVSEGEGGTFWASAEGAGWVAAPGVEVRNATGAGDAMTAGIAAALLGGHGVARAAEFGSRLAGVTLQSEATVSERVDSTLLREAVKEWRQDG